MDDSQPQPSITSCNSDSCSSDFLLSLQVSVLQFHFQTLIRQLLGYWQCFNVLLDAHFSISVAASKVGTPEWGTRREAQQQDLSAGAPLSCRRGLATSSRLAQVWTKSHGLCCSVSLRLVPFLGTCLWRQSKVTRENACNRKGSEFWG